ARSRRTSDQAAVRRVAATILADYGADQPAALAEALVGADASAFFILYSKLAAHGGDAVRLLEAELAKPARPKDKDEDQDRLAQRQANAAVALVKLGKADRVWPLLRHHPDPSVRSYLIDRLSLLGADPQVLLRRFEEKQDISARQALLLAL